MHSLTTHITFGACSDAPYSDVNHSKHVSMYYKLDMYTYSMAWPAAEADVAPTTVLVLKPR